MSHEAKGSAQALPNGAAGIRTRVSPIMSQGL